MSQHYSGAIESAPASQRTGAEELSPVYAVTTEAGDINSTCTLHSAGTDEAAAIVLSSDSSVLTSTVSAEDITSTIPLSQRTGAEELSPVYAVTTEAGDINSTRTAPHTTLCRDR